MAHIPGRSNVSGKCWWVFTQWDWGLSESAQAVTKFHRLGVSQTNRHLFPTGLGLEVEGQGASMAGLVRAASWFMAAFSLRPCMWEAGASAWNLFRKSTNPTMRAVTWSPPKGPTSSYGHIRP